MDTERNPDLVDALNQRRIAKDHLDEARGNYARAKKAHREWCSRVEEILVELISGQRQERIPGFEAEPDAAEAKATFAATGPRRRPKRNAAEATL